MAEPSNTMDKKQGEESPVHDPSDTKDNGDQPITTTPIDKAPTPTKSPQHLRLESAIARLEEQIEQRRHEIAETCTKLRTLDPDQPEEETVLANAQRTVKSHIALLHRYNAVKDVGMGLFGIIADAQGKRLVEVMRERGITGSD